MPAPNINTNFRRSDGTDVSQSFISKDYLLSAYPSIANQLTTPELWVWGSNTSLSLGNNDSINRSTPITTFIGGSNWKQVSAGYGHSAGIKNDGTLWVWGSGPSGQLGVGQLITAYLNISTPVTTFAGGNNWKQVSCSRGTTSAIKTDGSLWIWGKNSYGQIGDNTTVNRFTPVTTFAGGNNWKQVSCNYFGSTYDFVSAIKIDGTLWTWGSNYRGVLGTNDSITRSVPVTTFAGGNNWKQVSTSSNSFMLGVKLDGSLWGWGANSYGQLGNNDGVDRLTPVTTFIGGNDWKQVSCNNGASFAVKNNGSLWGWGRITSLGINNQSGNGRSTPVTTFAGGNNWKQVSCSPGVSTAAIKTDGSLWVWGSNYKGSLGTNDSSQSFNLTPITTFAGGNNWKQVSCGGYFIMAIRSTDIL